MTRFKITEIAGREKIERRDFITAEFLLTVEANSRKIAELTCTPKNLKDLVIGYLYTGGFINGLENLLSLRIERNRHKAVAEVRPPFCSAQSLRKKMRTPPGFFMTRENLFRLLNRFQKVSAEYQKTGGTHSAALCSRNKILFLREDLGRHNALDKVIGAALFKKHDLSNKFILISSRIPSEILLKIVRSRISLVASVGAPTDKAIQIARREGVTLIGFARGNRFNIYSFADRVK